MQTLRKISLTYILFFCLLLLSVFLVAIIPLKFNLFLLGGLISLAFVTATIYRPILLVYFIILTSAFAGLLEIFDSFNFGTTDLSVSGIRWVATGGIILGIMTIGFSKVKLLRQHLPFLIFELWVIFRWTISLHNANGLKDILFYSLPPLIWIYSIFVLISSKNREALLNKLENLLLYSALAPLFLYLILIPIGLIHFGPNGPDGLFGPRSITTFLLIILTLSLSNWKYASSEKQKRLAIIISLIIIGLILFTLSRMTTITSLLLFAIFMLKSPKLNRLIIGGTVGIVLAGIVFLGVPSFRSRLFYRDPQNINDVISNINTQGRNNYWSLTFNHAIQSPWIGWGPGTARELIAQTYYQGRLTEYHPHNEYLQVFHDMGIIGLILLLFAWVLLQIHFWKKWLRAISSKKPELAKWNMAATLSILVVLLNSFVDNTLHYAFVLGPVFIIVSCANVLNLEEKKIKTETTQT